MKRAFVLIAVGVLLLATQPHCETDVSPLVGIWTITNGIVPSPKGVEFFADGTGQPYDLQLVPNGPQFTGPFVWYDDNPHIVLREDADDGTHYFLGMLNSDTTMSGNEIWTESDNTIRVVSWFASKQ